MADPTPSKPVWVLVDLGWEDGEEEVVAVYSSEDTANAERTRRSRRRYRVFGPVPLDPPGATNA